MNERHKPTPELSVRAEELDTATQERSCLAENIGTPIELEANGIRNALTGSALDPDVLANLCIGEVAKAVLAVFSEQPRLLNEMRRSLVFDLEALEHGDSNTQQKALLMILKGYHGYGRDDRLLGLLQDQFVR